MSVTTSNSDKSDVAEMRNLVHQSSASHVATKGKRVSMSSPESGLLPETGANQPDYSALLIEALVPVSLSDGTKTKKNIKVALPLPREHFGSPISGSVTSVLVPHPVSVATSVTSSVAQEQQTSEHHAGKSEEGLSGLGETILDTTVQVATDSGIPRADAPLVVSNPYAGMSFSRQVCFMQLDAFQELRKKPTTKYMAIDVESLTWGDHGITEVGVTTWNGGPLYAQQFTDAKFFHYKSKERLYKHNKMKLRGKDFNHKDHFFGTSVVDWIPKIGQRIMSKVNGMKRTGDLVIVVHGGKSDTKDMNSIGCDFSGLTVLDTQKLHRAIHDDNSQIGLEDIVAGHPHRSTIPFHNAGNDAYYTMWALAKMVERLDQRARDSEKK